MKYKQRREYKERLSWCNQCGGRSISKSTCVVCFRGSPPTLEALPSILYPPRTYSSQCLLCGFRSLFRPYYIRLGRILHSVYYADSEASFVHIISASDAFFIAFIMRIQKPLSSILYPPRTYSSQQLLCGFRSLFRPHYIRLGRLIHSIYYADSEASFVHIISASDVFFIAIIMRIQKPLSSTLYPPRAPYSQHLLCGFRSLFRPYYIHQGHILHSNYYADSEASFVHIIFASDASFKVLITRIQKLLHQCYIDPRRILQGIDYADSEAPSSMLYPPTTHSSNY